MQSKLINRLDKIRESDKYDETCFRCGEKRLMWKLDWEDKEVKLWQPYHFHVCPDGSQALAKDSPTHAIQDN